ncbi:hypothetical protein C8R47DRAFT_1179451 [Mycena vitilis]|nr:hypothetical protein C8R47DRAFT_1179933 [Mycena vitilis]KAJ6472133.1 hypothetical protein C8R47DRAFT_1179451 [Mycena vitilis]
MRADYYDNVPGDQRLAHDYDAVNVVARERGYKNRGTIDVSKEGMGAVYGDTIRGFFEKHMHEDEEMRYRRGDVAEHSWFKDPIRVALDSGDLVVLPAGIYHRFTVDEKKNAPASWDEHKWTPHARSADTDANAHRIEYLRDIGVGA